MAASCGPLLPGGPGTPSGITGGQAYIPLPDDAFQLPNLEITIAKGSLQASIPISVFPNKLSTSEKYMLAFILSGANGYAVASNLNTMLFGMIVQ